MYVYEVTTESMDGVHVLGKFNSLEEAKTFATDWLGKNAEWVNSHKAIDCFGGVLRIEKWLEDVGADSSVG